MRAALFTAAMVLSVFATACSLIRVDPVTAEEREVTPVSDAGRTVTLSEPIVWLDAPGLSATKGVKLPMGDYPIEAEDSEYLYFKAPGPIELRLLEEGAPVDGPDMSGGLALGKGALFPVVSPAVYVDVDSTRRMLVMKLGYDFMQMRGKQWTRNF